MDPAEPMKVYTDASISKFVIGVGVKVIMPSEGIRFELGVPTKPGLNSTEAELYALLIGIDTVKSVIHCHKMKRQVDVIFYTDCEPALRSVFGFSTPRSEAAKTLAKKVKRNLDKAKRTHYKTWSLQPVRSASNQADKLARAARERWRAIWKQSPRAEASGAS
jgi:hypothetical protein